ncbi:hypothetical protein [Ramlibacter sp.]|uniref:hypothetical protein n=1 Tax=Ramlibacter sp. TaxID=1917967 RepID=UPI003D128D00
MKSLLPLFAALAIAGCATKPPLETGVQCMSPKGVDAYSRECRAWRLGPTIREQQQRRHLPPFAPAVRRGGQVAAVEQGTAA